jgi:hypothetical protein
MKNVLLFLILFISMFTSVLSAQVSDIVPLKERIDSATYIVEGTIVSSKAFIHYDSTGTGHNIYTAGIVAISKILKGNLNCGHVQVVIEGGVVGNEGQRNSEDPTELNVGGKGIFLLTDADVPHYDTSLENSNITELYDGGGLGLLTYVGPDAVRDMFHVYHDLDSLYSFISLRSGYTYTDCGDVFIKPKGKPNFNGNDQPNYKPLNVPQKETIPGHNPKIRKAPLGYTPNLIIQFDNQRIRDSGTYKLFDFDVDVETSDAGYYLNNSFLRIRYGTAMFGSYVASGSRAYITKTDMDLSNYALGLYDNSANQLVLKVDAKDPSNFYRQEIKNFMVLAHVVIQISTCTGSSPDLRFSKRDTAFNNSNTWFTYNPDDDYYTQAYPCQSAVIDSDFYTTCNPPTPVISGISPSTVTAGTGTTITIYGTDFGTQPGMIELSNANELYTYTRVQDTDIIDWANDAISLVVPSYVAHGVTANDFGTAGTGPIKVVSAFGVESSEYYQLQVNYALENALSFASGDSNKLPVYLKGDDSGAITFTFNSDFASDTNRVKVFKKAARQWTCNSNINFRFNSSTSSITSVSDDGTNIVEMGSVKNSAAHAVTSTFWQKCTGDNHKFYQTGSDIVFNEKRAFTYDTTGAWDPTHVNFYSVALHEIGHAAGLYHNLNLGDVMFPSIDYGQVDTFLKLDDIEGAHAELTSGHFASFSCATMMTPKYITCHLNSIKPQTSFNKYYRVYPNPSSGTIRLEKIGGPDETEGIVITDMLGKIVLQTRESFTINQPIEESIQSLQPGIYTLRIIQKEGQVNTLIARQ